MRSSLVAVVLGAVLVAAALGGCVGREEDLALYEASLGSPGPWHMPASVRATGERQHVAYDAAPAWTGGAGCSGGLQAGTRDLATFLEGRYPQVLTIGGYSCRPNTADTSRMSVHGTGRALDIMLPLSRGDADNGLGDPIANWLVTNAESLGVQLIIWDRWDWNASYSGRKDSSYGGPNPHIDHIHVELSVEGARRSTPWFTDRDGDGVRNERDNCPMEANREQGDDDRDGVGNACDNCRREANEHQADRDRDGVGDRCDNCWREANREQSDPDGDGRGNACDNCDAVENRGQLDTDDDGAGDACDRDDDGDSIPDAGDNCRLVSNEGQLDRDMDGRGDRCDGDDDDDTVADDADNCPGRANADQADEDGDGRGDACDDSDDDGTFDIVDLCHAVPDPQTDLDGDGVGDACDDDLDGDDVPNPTDLCPEAPESGTEDLDGDGLGDACDGDLDGDTVLNDVDACPTIPSESHLDADADGVGDECDPDPGVSEMADPGAVHDDDWSDEGDDEPVTPARRAASGCSAGAGASTTGATWAAALLLGYALRRRRRPGRA